MSDGAVEIDVELNLDKFEAQVKSAGEALSNGFSTDGIDRASKSIEKLGKESKDASKVVRGSLGESLDDSSKKATKLGESAKKGFAELKEGAKKGFDELKNGGTSLGQLITLMANPFVAAAALATAAIVGIGKAMQEGSKKNMIDERLLVDLRSLQQNAGDAVKIIDELGGAIQFAAWGDFDVVAKSAAKLTQFGMAADDVIDSMKMIGDIAMDDVGKMDTMADALGKVSQQGKLTSRELNAMISSGFNPLVEISRTTGRSMADLRADMEAGAIGVDMVTEAMRTATSEGGQYYQMSEKLSVTTQGLNQNIKNNADTIKANLMAPIDGFAKAFKNAFVGATADFANFTSKLQEIGKKLASNEKLWAGTAVIMKAISVNVQTMVKYFGELLGLFTPLIDHFKNLTKGTKDTKNETSFLTTAMAILTTAFQITINVSTLFVRIIRVVISSVMLLGTALAQPTLILGKLIEALGQLFSGNLVGAKNTLSEIPNMVKDTMTGAVNNLKKEIEGMAEAGAKLTPSAIKKTYDDAIESMEETAREAAERARLSAQDTGQTILEGMQEGMEGETDNLTDTVEDIVEVITHNMSSLAGEAQKALKWLTDAERAELETLMASIDNLTEAQVEQLKSLIEKASQEAKDFAMNMSKLLGDALSDSLSLYGDYLSNQAEMIDAQYARELKGLDDLIKAKNKAREDEHAENERRLKEGEISEYEYKQNKLRIDQEAQEAEEQMQAEKEALEAERAERANEIAHKQFNADKTNSIAKIGIDSARAIAALWVSGAGMGPMGIAWAAAQSAVIGAMMAAQIAVIGGKKFVGAFEKGGIIPGAGYALVGERGPELIATRGGERVYNNSQTMQILGQMGNSYTTSSEKNSNVVNNNTFNIQSGDTQGIAKEVSRILGRSAIARG